MVLRSPQPLTLLLLTRVTTQCKIEAIQRSYTKFVSIQHVSYWERLKQLRLHSQERKREKCAVSYIWKILEGLVPYFGIESYTNSRMWCYCIVPKILTLPSGYRTRYCNSLAVKSPQVFNIHFKNPERPTWGGCRCLQNRTGSPPVKSSG